MCKHRLKPINSEKTNVTIKSQMVSHNDLLNHVLVKAYASKTHHRYIHRIYIRYIIATYHAIFSDLLQNAEPVACRDSMKLHIVRYYKLTINSGSTSYSRIVALLSHEYDIPHDFKKLVFFYYTLHSHSAQQKKNKFRHRALMILC